MNAPPNRVYSCYLLKYGMKTLIKNELVIYLVLFTLLAVGVHNDLLHTPLERIGLMIDRSAYIHPFIYTTLVYLFFAVVRYAIIFVKRLKNRSNN